ncbi:MobV family relaxase [Xylanibacter rarus]|uniref:Recombinase n=1 Tax=Xylanibacter rarus TaxID=1676614 RepID=A0A8E1QVV0_9BACT|nr:MobV family relaxase [Xylanibacter rarus]KOO67054.1 recombinase [Xylanibacter rarus]
MANAKQVMDFRPSKGITTAQSNEHQRRWTDKGWERAVSIGNYDPTREHLNFEIKAGKVCQVDKSKSIPERMDESLSARGIKDPNSGLEEPRFRTVVNFIFGGSRERMQEIAFGEQKVNFEKGADNSQIERCKEIEEWAKDVYSFVSDKYGEENIVSFVVHLDELNPHAHCTLLPIQENKFAYKQIFAGKDKYEFSARMKQLHSDFAEVNKRWGMSRGTSVSESGARHRTTEEYRRHLSEECTSIEEQLGQHQKALSDLKVEIQLAERRVKGLNSMVENLRKAKAEKERQIAALEATMKSHIGNSMSISAEKANLEKELASIQEKLADKQEKLKVADRQLSVLKEDMNTISERTEELKVEAYRYSHEIHSKVDVLLKDVMLETLVSEHSERLAEIGTSEQSIFDGSLLQSLTEQGADVMHCATLLFLGMVNDATTFAETHGGGGGKNDLKWGRDENEDNRAWAKRCMMTASKMMRPASGKKQKR